MLTVMMILNNIFSGIKVLESQQKSSALRLETLDLKIEVLVGRISDTEKQCALTEASLKSNNETRGQVQSLVNGIVKRLAIDENHPR